MPLGRVLGNEIGQVFADLHRDEGVDVRLGVGVDSIEGNGRVERVVLADGTSVAADVVVVGIGVIPEHRVARRLRPRARQRRAVRRGLLGRARGGGRRRHRRAGPTPRSTARSCASSTGTTPSARPPTPPGALLAGRDEAEPFAAVPWFWSDQYDRKLQLAGRPRPDDEVRAWSQGSLDERRFVALYGRAGRLVGVLGMNRPRHVMQLRSAIAERISFDGGASPSSECGPHRCTSRA